MLDILTDGDAFLSVLEVDENLQASAWNLRHWQNFCQWRHMMSYAFLGNVVFLIEEDKEASRSPLNFQYDSVYLVLELFDCGLGYCAQQHQINLS